MEALKRQELSRWIQLTITGHVHGNYVDLLLEALKR